MNSSRSPGFTLLEMLLVMALVIMLMSMVLTTSPRWGAVPRLESAALRVEATVNRTRASAAVYGEPFSIRISNRQSAPGTPGYGEMLVEANDYQARSAAGLPPNVFFQMDPDSSVTLEFFPSGEFSVTTNDAAPPGQSGLSAIYPLVLYHEQTALFATVNVYRAGAARLAAPTFKETTNAD